MDARGEGAPSDMSGSTPLACIKRQGHGYKPAIARELFAPGDRSLLPTTPWELRGGALAQNDTAATGGLAFAHAAAANCNYMEDRLVCAVPLEGAEGVSLFAVLDGHGGSFAAEYVSGVLAQLVAEGLSGGCSAGEEQVAEALRAAFLAADEALRVQPHMAMQRLQKTRRMGDEVKTEVTFDALEMSGSTGCCVVVTPSHIITANIGDSRAVMGSEGLDGATTAVALSTDHTPDMPGERARVEAAGGQVVEMQHSRTRLRFGAPPEEAEEEEEATVLRVGHPAAKGFSLAMTRSFGDFALKMDEGRSAREQVVVAEPEVTVRTRGPGSRSIVVASDGIWDELSNEQAVATVAQHLREGDGEPAARCAAAADALVKEALMRGSHDNMTAIVVDLQAEPSAGGGGGASPLLGRQLFP